MVKRKVKGCPAAFQPRMDLLNHLRKKVFFHICGSDSFRINRKEVIDVQILLANKLFTIKVKSKIFFMHFVLVKKKKVNCCNSL